MFKKLRTPILILTLLVGILVFRSFSTTGEIEQLWFAADAVMRSFAIGSDGSVYVTGGEQENPWWNSLCRVIKYDSEGRKLWERTFSGNALHNMGLRILVDSQDSCYVKIDSREEYLLVKLDSEGRDAWPAPLVFAGINDSGKTSPHMLIDRSDNIYLLNSEPSAYPGRLDTVLYKISSQGAFLWNQPIRRECAWPTAAVLDAEQNIIIGSSDWSVMKYSPAGNRIWYTWIDNIRSGRPSDVAVDEDGNVYLTGTYFWSEDGGVTVKFDSSGNEVWKNHFNFTDTGQDERENPYHIAVDRERNVYISGYATSIGTPSFLVKYDSQGAESWRRRVEGGGNFALALDKNGEIYLGHMGGGESGASGGTIVKIDRQGQDITSLRIPQENMAGRNIFVDDSLNIYYVGWQGTGVYTQFPDTESPASSIQVSPQPNENGWSNSDVTVSIQAVDNPGGSGVKEIHFLIDGLESIVKGDTATASIPKEGITAFTYWAVDEKGNVEPRHDAAIRIDKTPPVISAQASPAPSADGWIGSNVTISFSALDALSGLGFVTPSLVVQTEGAAQEFSGEAVDQAGNRSTAAIKVNIDLTDPIVMITATPSVLWPPNRKMVDVVISGTTSDALSGIASMSFRVVDEYGYCEPSLTQFGTIQLEAWREGSDADGRRYEIFLRVVDKAGRATERVATVIVPKSNGR